MTNNSEILLLETLKGLRNEVSTLRDEMHEEFGDLKQLMLAISRGISGMERDTAEIYTPRDAGGVQPKR